MKSGILFSVGAGGRNVDLDVETVQRMLNNVPMLIGPPAPLLKEDGDCGALTIAAIRRFQKRAELTVQDGKIDPGKTTHTRLAFVTEQVKELPDRMDLGLKLASSVLMMVNPARRILGKMVDELNNFKPPLKGPDADRARAALHNHFSLSETQQNDQSVFGRIYHRLNGIGVRIEQKPIAWSQATMKQSKIDNKRHIGDLVPSIYKRPGTQDIVFTPNFKQFDQRDRMGWGPQSLGYEMIKGVGRVELGTLGNDHFFESDEPGYPGDSVNDAIERNPAAYGGFVMEMHLRRAQPFGQKFRQL